ncbi:hypothetical protein [Asticcacaulis taihuensis]|uniref:hypothetical protein n=1 Tax=Asticcacaulis taihuensis TaxID=260084 RepID=UPI0026EB1BED|nr:hypothetical protein [Asticcacaulis taihuensis]
MRKFPLMILPIALYNLIAFGLLFSGGADIADPWLHLGMPTMAGQWIISVADLVIFAGLGCLFIEVLKSTSTSDSSITNHVLGMLVLIVAIVEFLLMPPFATSAFFLLSVMCGLDVLAGFIVTTVGARKDIGA